MSGQGPNLDPGAEMAARIGGLVINSDDTFSPIQQAAHAHSPSANTHGYASIGTPTSRVSHQIAHQPYSPYADQGGYSYYAAATSGVSVDANYAAAAAAAGMGVAPAVTYPYTGTAADLLSVVQSQPTSAYESYATSTEMYGNQGDRQGGRGRQSHNQHSQNPNLQPLGRGGRHNNRSILSQGQIQQQQAAAASLQQANAAAAAAAGYYGYQNSRPYWMSPQSIYVPQGKKDQQGYGYQTRNNQSSHNGRNTNVNNSHFGYSESVTPTHGNYNLSSATSNPYSNARHISNQYSIASAQGYGNANAYSGHGYQNAASYLYKSRRMDDAGVVRSPLLEDFRLNKSKKWELRDIFGHIVEFSGDQHGSRFIQQKLSEATAEDRQKLFDEIMPNAYQLMTDVFGNYVTQKMFELGDQLQKAALAKKMEGHVLQLSMQTYGCRVVQKALEHVLVVQQAKLVSELEPHVLECVRSSNANHVIQKLILLAPPQSVPDAFVGHVEELSKHPYGCRVLQKMFESLPDGMKRPLLEEMHKCTLPLIEDQFGNYVVQSVIVEGLPVDRDKVINVIKGNVLRLARHKFASNVVEKAIIHANEADRKILIDELVEARADGTNQVGMLLRDAFGNFPLQTALKHAKDDQRQELLDIVTALLPQIRHTPVGKRLENKIAEFEAEGHFSTPRKSISSSTATTTTVGGSEGTNGFAMSRSASSETAAVSPEPAVKNARSSSTTPKTLVAGVQAQGDEKTGSAATVNAAQTLEDLLQ
ncbi:pumilio 2 [Kwoniella heveanensis BCC8398]|uniref:Pumilio 2 n=1 Tax=Kwoniella heveanensis BCC8398 TaxID=1296120 RepID=A0A1B9GZD5_9TREE|nr:pumilio 2 [Kwoniella heveanensis BCC8398]